MTVLTVKQVLELGEGETVQAFKGRVKKVWDQSAGTKDGGEDWKRQGVTCQDGSHELTLTLWNRSQLKAAQWEGQVIYVTCSEPDFKTKIYKNKKTGKDTFQLSVPEGAEITKLADMSAKIDAPQAAARVGNSLAPASPTRGTAKTYCAQCANAMTIAMLATEYIYKEMARLEAMLTPEMFQGYSIELYRSMERRGFVDALPVGRGKPPAKPTAKVETKPETAPYEPGQDDEPEPEAPPSTGPTGEDDSEVPF